MSYRRISWRCNNLLVSACNRGPKPCYSAKREGTEVKLIWALNTCVKAGYRQGDALTHDSKGRTNENSRKGERQRLKQSAQAKGNHAREPGPTTLRGWRTRSTGCLLIERGWEQSKQLKEKRGSCTYKPCPRAGTQWGSASGRERRSPKRAVAEEPFMPQIPEYSRGQTVRIQDVLHTTTAHFSVIFGYTEQEDFCKVIAHNFR